MTIVLCATLFLACAEGCKLALHQRIFEVGK
jgi:hypothetical protein